MNLIALARKWLMLSMFSLPRDVFRYAARAHRDAIALISPRGTLTFGELASRVGKWNRIFRDRGLKPRQKIFTILSDDWDQVAVRLAGMDSGLIQTGFHGSHPADFVLQAASVVRPGLLLYEPNLGDQAANRAAELWGDGFLLRLDARAETELAAAEPEWSEANIDGEDLCALGFTSGTSGQPKCLTSSHRALIQSLKLLVANFNPSGDFAKMTLSAIPLAGAGGGILLPSLLAGSALLLPSRYDSEEILELAIRHRVERLFVTPSVLIDLLDSPRFTREMLPALREVVYGTAPMAAAKVEEALARLGPVLCQGYGLAEVLPPVCLLRPEDHFRGGVPAPPEILSSAGKPVRRVHVAVVDENGGMLPAGAIGEVTIQSPTAFAGYWQRPDLTAELVRDGRVYTRDVGYFDDAGWLHILDRRQDVVRRGKRVIYPRLVEEVAHRQKGVKEACLTALAGTNELVLCVSPRADWRAPDRRAALLSELKQHLARNLPDWQQPDHLRIWDEIPRSVLAKISRPAVRARLAAEAAQDPAA